MNYIKYLFSDKKALPYWGFLYFCIFNIYTIGIIVGIKSNQPFEMDPIGALINLFILFSFILYYTPGYINHLRQAKFIKKYSTLIENNSIKETDVEIFIASYHVTALRTSYYAKINPKSRHEIFTTFIIENKIGILGYGYDFGILRRDACPIVIDTDSNTKKYSFAKTPRISSINWTGDDMEILFERPVFGLTKIKLIGWKHDMKTNSR
jgi:hypothetical protein